ncbi:MAG: hypothetical protein H6832_11980 [Planctomycetes bacterium]|nr:hypothetical protein [Planctomycetota bacterium]
MQRRSFLGAGLACGFGPRSSEENVRHDCAAVAGRTVDRDTFATKVLTTARDHVPALVVEAHREGMSVRDLLGAALLAGVREVAPSPIGGPVHCMMMVASASYLIRWLDDELRLLPALFNLDRVKNSQTRDENGPRFSMRAASVDASVHEAPNASLEREFVTALRDWKLEHAEALAIELHDRLSANELFELLWPAAIRDFRVIGHKAIYASQARRALEDLGWRDGRDVVRSVLAGLLDQNPYDRATSKETREILALYDANAETAASLEIGSGANVPGVARDPARSRALELELRTRAPEGAAAAMTAAARDGADAGTLWDALRLRSFDQVLRAPTIAGVHPVTSINALHAIATTTRDRHTARTCLLQGASWLALFEPLIEQRTPAERRALRIDTIEAGREKGNPSEPREEGQRRSRAARLVADGEYERFARLSASTLARKAREDHDYKFAAAALEEIANVAPELAPSLAGAAMAFLHHEGDPDATVYDSVRKLGHK